MAPLYKVDSSPGKGQGIFVTKAITAGTVILQDNMIMLIRKDVSTVTNQDVRVAFERLSPSEQTQFMSLHEGKERAKTQMMRKYRTNIFGGEDYCFLCLNISKANHSCLPNASIAGVSGSNSRVLIAARDLDVGEEVLINYQKHAECMTTQHRRASLEDLYGIVCSCQLCQRTGSEAEISDARRQLIDAIRFRLQDFQLLQSTSRNVPTLQEMCAYQFLLVKLQEAEMIAPELIALSYQEAAQVLRRQMESSVSTQRDWFSSTVVLKQWTEMAARFMSASQVRKAPGCASGMGIWSMK